MKKRITKILGVVLTLALLSSLCIITAPVSADPGNVKWESQSTPSAGGRVMTTPGAVLGPMEQNCDGSAMFVYDNSGTGNVDLFKSTNGGRTWSATGFNYPGPIVAITPSKTEPDVIYVATPTTVYKSVDGGANFPSLVAAAPLDSVGNPSTIRALDVLKVGNKYVLTVGTAGSGLNRGDIYTLDENDIFPAWQNQGFNAHFGLNIDWVVAVEFTPDTTAGVSMAAIGVNNAAGGRVQVSIFSSGNWGAVIGDAVNVTPPLTAPFNPIRGIATMADIEFPSGFNLTTNPNFFFGFNDNSGPAIEGVWLFNGVPAIAGPSAATRITPVSNVNDVCSLDVVGSVTTASIMAGTQNGAVLRSLDGGATWAPIAKPPTGGVPNISTFVVMADDFLTSGEAVALNDGPDGGLSFTEDSGATWNQISLMMTSIDTINDLAFGNPMYMSTTGITTTPGVNADAFTITASNSGDTFVITNVAGGTDALSGIIAVSSGAVTMAITTDPNTNATADNITGLVNLPDDGDEVTITALQDGTVGTFTITTGLGEEVPSIGVDNNVNASFSGPVGVGLNVYNFVLPDDTNDVATLTISSGSVTVTGAPYVANVITFVDAGQVATVTNTSGVTQVSFAQTSGAPTGMLTVDDDGDVTQPPGTPLGVGAPVVPAVLVDMNDVFAAAATTATVQSIWRYDDNWERIWSSTIDVLNPVGALTYLVETAPGTDGDTLYTAYLGGFRILRSANSGQTFTAQTNGVPTAITAWAVISDGTIICGDAGGNVNVTVNNGLSWPLIPTATGAAAPISDIELHPDNAGEMLVAAVGGNVRSTTDYGTTWSSRGNSGLGAGGATFVTYDASDGSTIYATDAANGGVARRSGSSWKTIDNTGQAGEFPVGAGTGIYSAEDGALYVADATAGVGALRSLDPKSPAPYWEATSEGMSGSVGFGALAGTGNLWATEGSTKLWAVDTVGGNSIRHYTDTLAAPVTGLTTGAVTAATATLSWDALTGAKDYQIQVDTQASFATCAATMAGINVIYGTGQTAANLSGLNSNTTYYVRVRVAANPGAAAPGNGAPVRSYFSDSSDFTTLPLSPVAPIDLVPANGAVNIPVMGPAFAWLAVPGAISYDYELTTDPTFATITEGTKSITVPYLVWNEALEYETAYYWRVRAVGPAGPGSWVTSVFTTVAETEPPVTVEPPPTPNIDITLPQPTVIPPDVIVEPPDVTVVPQDITVIPPDVIVDIPDIVLPTPTSTIVEPKIEMPEEATPVYIWIIVAIGAVLVTAVIILIIRTRRVV